MRRNSESEPKHEPSDISRRGFFATIGVFALSGLMSASCSYERPLNHEYPWHDDIATTMFYAGEPKNGESILSNEAGAWTKNWPEAYGGVDTPDPSKRCGYHPCDFTPKENPFYFALPFSDYTEAGPRPPEELKKVPWYDGQPIQGKTSVIKNQWGQFFLTLPNGTTRTAYAQWEDVGPKYDDDADYVFGNKRPRNRLSGLDCSPAVWQALGANIEEGRIFTSWRFVDAEDVPDGPWREIVTTSGPTY